MIQKYDINSYKRRYANEIGVLRFLLDKVKEIPEYQDIFTIKNADFNRIRFTGDLNFNRFLETLKKYSEKCFDHTERVVFWKIREAGLDWEQEVEIKEFPQEGRPLVITKNIFLPNITFKIIDRKHLISYLLLKTKAPVSQKVNLKIINGNKIMLPGILKEIKLINTVQKNLCSELLNLQPNAEIRTDKIINICYEDCGELGTKEWEKRLDCLRGVAKRLNKKIEKTFGLEKTFKIGTNECFRIH